MKKGTKLKICKVKVDLKGGARKVSQSIKAVSKGGDKPVIDDLMFDDYDLHKPSWCGLNNTAIIITTPEREVTDIMLDYVSTKLAIKAKALREHADLLSISVDNYSVKEIEE